MKLRNKKTGEILRVGEDVYIQSLDNGRIEVKKPLADGNMCFYYDSLSEFFKEWEDYEPKEPLIKDERIRKFVRDWSEVFGVTKVYVTGIGDGKEYLELYAQDNGVVDGRIRISIKTQDGIWIGKEYTITELCGEEEDNEDDEDQRANEY